eukprot:3118998-Pyramimonas_sp.AAC.2
MPPKKKPAAAAAPDGEQSALTVALDEHMASPEFLNYQPAIDAPQATDSLQLYGAFIKSLRDAISPLTQVGMMVIKRELQLLVERREDDWKLADQQQSFITEAAKMIRAMLRHTQQTILKARTHT